MMALQILRIFSSYLLDEVRQGPIISGQLKTNILPGGATFCDYGGKYLIFYGILRCDFMGESAKNGDLLIFFNYFCRFIICKQSNFEYNKKQGIIYL